MTRGCAGAARPPRPPAGHPDPAGAVSGSGSTVFRAPGPRRRSHGYTALRPGWWPALTPGRCGTMPRLAMRTPHHGRQDLPRVADRLEGGVESIAEAEHGVYGHRRIPCLPHHRDQLWEPDLLSIAGSHTSPLPSRGLLDAVRSTCATGAVCTGCGASEVSSETLTVYCLVACPRRSGSLRRRPLLPGRVPLACG